MISFSLSLFWLCKSWISALLLCSTIHEKLQHLWFVGEVRVGFPLKFLRQTRKQWCDVTPDETRGCWLVFRHLQVSLMHFVQTWPSVCFCPRRSETVEALQSYPEEAERLLTASTERWGSVTGLVLPVVLVVLVKLVGLGVAAQTADVSADYLAHCNKNRRQDYLYQQFALGIQTFLSLYNFCLQF